MDLDSVLIEFTTFPLCISGGDDDDDAHPSSKLEWPEQSRMCSRLRLLYMKTIIIIMQIIRMIIWTHLTLVPTDCVWKQPSKKKYALLCG